MSPVCNPRILFCQSYIDPGTLRSRVLDGYRAQVGVVPKMGIFSLEWRLDIRREEEVELEGREEGVELS